MSFFNKKVIVTGGCGFIGSHLVDRLVAEGANVLVVDDFSTGSIHNISGSKEKITLLKSTVSNMKNHENLCLDAEYVFHFAANASVPRSSTDPFFDFESNLTSTVDLLLLCRKMPNLKHVVFASSAAVYGSSMRGESKEDLILSPDSPYGVSKMSCEHYGRVFGELYGVPWTALRLFNVYGPRMRKFVIFDILKKLKQLHKGDPLSLLGSGNEIRHYCYVSDAVSAILKAGELSITIGKKYNLAGRDPVKISELASIILSIKNEEREVLFSGESWKGDQTVMWADYSKLVVDVSYQPIVALRDGLEMTNAWYESSFELSN